jgi:uncharacterized lipoprotein YmbA
MSEVRHVKRIAQSHRRIVSLRTPVLAAVLAGWIVTGCLGSSPSVEYYTFDTLSHRVESSQGEAGPELAVAVGPVHLPGYLDRQQIASRPGGSRIRYDEFNRWAGMLDSEIPRVLAGNLRILLASDRVVAYPTTALFALDYRVVVEIERFEAERGGEALLVARWTVQSEDRSEPLTVERSDLQGQVSSKSYSDLAAAHSELLAELSRAIAAKLREIDRAQRETADGTDDGAEVVEESEEMAAP